MDVEIRGIGNFDVVITDVDEHSALKAIEASNTPRVRAAFQQALEKARTAFETGIRYTFVESPLGVEMYDEHHVMQAMLRRYERRAGAFWQAYIRIDGTSIRRNDLDTLKRVAIEKLEKLKKLDTSLEGLL